MPIYYACCRVREDKAEGKCLFDPEARQFLKPMRSKHERGRTHYWWRVREDKKLVLVRWKWHEEEKKMEWKVILGYVVPHTRTRGCFQGQVIHHFRTRGIPKNPVLAAVFKLIPVEAGAEVKLPIGQKFSEEAVWDLTHRRVKE